MVPKRRIFGEINYPQLNQKTAIQFLDDVLERLPFRMEVIHYSFIYSSCGRRVNVA